MIFKQDKLYPKTGALLRAILPLYEFLHPEIFAAFLKHCKDEKLARQALSVGLYPEVRIANISDEFPSVPPTAQGLFSTHLPKTGKNVVILNNDYPDLYEKVQNGSDAKTIEITALHEMVHWARYNGRNPEGCEEAGLAFENEFRPFASRGGQWCFNQM